METESHLNRPTDSPFAQIVNNLKGMYAVEGKDGTIHICHSSGSSIRFHANGDLEIHAARDVVTTAGRFTRIQTTEQDVENYYKKQLVEVLNMALYRKMGGVIHAGCTHS